MSRINPYATYLGSEEPLKVLSASPRKIEQLMEDLGAERMDQPPAPGKWSSREIVCHLADTELAFAFRLRQTLAEEDHVIQPFDQEKWAVNYAAYDAREALTLFCAVRNWNMSLLRSVDPDLHDRTVTHPERGAMTFWTIVETMAGHDLNHLAQLQTIARNFAPTH
jgi:uncharacterized damage-inducible protein DinB